MSSFRILKFSLQDIARNMSLSFMTVLILVLMLLSVNTLIIVRVITTQFIDDVQSRLDISVHFDPNATDEQVQEVRNMVDALPQVSYTQFFTSEESLQRFQEFYGGNEVVKSSASELSENPLGPTLIIKAEETEDYQEIIATFDIPEYGDIIEAKTSLDTQQAIEKIGVISAQVERFGLFLSILFAFIAFVIIFNTIRVAIYTQRMEISIKKLVGATNWFVRGPYLVESCIFSIISTIVTGGLLFFVLRFLDPRFAPIFGNPHVLTNYYTSHILELAGIQFLAVLVLTVGTSAIAMRRYLRV